MKFEKDLNKLKVVLQKNNSSKSGAIKALKEQLKSAYENNDFISLFEFYFEVDRSDNIALINVLGAFAEFFEDTVTTLINQSTSPSLLLPLSELIKGDLGNKCSKKNLLLGIVSEKLSQCSTHIIRVIKLREARYFYRKAGAKKDVNRIQNLLSSEAKSVSNSLMGKIALPEKLRVQIEEFGRNFVEDWKTQSLEKKLSSLIYGIPYSLPSVEQKKQSFWDTMEEIGVVVTQMVAPDGRVSGNNPPCSIERRNFSCWEGSFLFECSIFKEPFQSWLREKENSVYEKILQIFVSNFDWNDDLSNSFKDGFIGLLEQKYSFCMALWIPFFEQALRNILVDKGENVLQEKDRIGLENFILLDGLLKKAEKFFPAEVVRYWKYVLTTYNGVGWNLRNYLSHGLMPYGTFNFEYSFSVFLCYCFLFNDEKSN